MLGLLYIPHAHLDTYTFSTLLTVVYFGDFLKPLGETGITLMIQTDLFLAGSDPALTVGCITIAGSLEAPSQLWISLCSACCSLSPWSL